MNERYQPGDEDFRRKNEIPESHGPELIFVDDGYSTTYRQLEAQHPLGPEAASDYLDKRAARTVLERIRQHPMSKPFLRLVAFLVAGGVAYGGMQEKLDEDTQESIELREAMQDPEVAYEVKKLILEELIQSGELVAEFEGREGRSRWSQIEKLAYEGIPRLSDKFEYLHKDNPNIIAAYRNPKERIKQFDTFFVLLNIEFCHSPLPYEFTDQVIEDAGRIFPTLEESEAFEMYSTLEPLLFKADGLRAVRDLAQGLVAALPSDHPIVERINQRQWLNPQVDQWFGSSTSNSVIFDQVNGRIKIYHHVGDRTILLDVFPGNGGPAEGVAWERGLPAHVAVRTPDGNYSFDRAFSKKSASWKYSWVADQAPLRWTVDKKNVEYQDTDGKWRLLTGEDAEFTGFGAPQKPFRDLEHSSMYQAASQKQDDGTYKYPHPFTIDDVLEKGGKMQVARAQLRKTWDRNDFGPKAISIRDSQGKLMTIYFHSSPGDEKPEQFLDYSHGCVHMKPGDVEAMDGYLDRGSKIRISAVEVPEVEEGMDQS
ncbi:MAG TPA: L,D-transpeptidase [Patescibacteria group bacterium]|nr:L,D-transpeptidase [Patescibacteria group bacterium]